jgi:hypothetical protein
VVWIGEVCQEVGQGVCVTGGQPYHDRCEFLSRYHRHRGCSDTLLSVVDAFSDPNLFGLVLYFEAKQQPFDAFPGA